MSARVLVVDDDASIRRLVELTLRTEGIDVDTAADGHEAVRMAVDSPPALVVLDVMMPGIDGWTVAERLRGTPSTAGVPIVFLTALARDRDVERGRALGAVGNVTKPFDVTDLVDLVREIIAVGGLRG